MPTSDLKVCTRKLPAKREGKPQPEGARQAAPQLPRPVSPGEDQHMKIKALHKMVILQIRLHCLQTLMEYVGLEGTFKDPLVQPPCHGQGHLLLDQVAQMVMNAQTWE